MDILSRSWRGLLGGAVGLALGLLVGWVIWPVKYVGEAYTYELNAAEKAEYVAAAADAYGLTRDGEVARQRFEAWTVEEKVGALAQVYVEDEARSDQAAAERVTGLALEMRLARDWNPGAAGQALGVMAAQYRQGPRDQAAINRAQYLDIFASRLGVTTDLPALSPKQQGTLSPTGRGETTEAATGPVMLSIVALAVLVAGLIVIGVAVVLVRRRISADEQEPTPKASRVRWTEEEWPSVPSASEGGPEVTGEGSPAPASEERPSLLPLKQWTSTYRGTGNFDESFNIETQDGAFVGECGMGRLSGVSAEKASEFEVWLFNKIETRNVSQVLVSDIASGGNLTAAPGLEFTMQSGLLQVEVIVAEAEIVDGYFKTLSVTMTARMG